MSGEIRIKMALGVMAVLMLWPIVHMVLSLRFDLNSWKYAGWGMYASTQPSEIALKVFLVEEEGWPLPSIGPLLGATYVVAVRDGETTPVDLKSLIGTPDLRRLGKLGQWIRTTRENRHITELTDFLDDFAARQVSGTYPNRLVLLSEFRLDLIARQTYVVTSIYLNRGGKTRKVGVYGSDELKESEVLEEVNARVQTLLVTMSAVGLDQ